VKRLEVQELNLKECAHLRDIAQAILNAPAIGVLIYQENIVYANEFFLELTGYSLEELNNMNILEIFPPEEREPLKAVVERRLKGEKFTRVYHEMKILRKNGEIRHTLTFANTILYQEKPAGFVVFIDFTKQKRLENIVLMLREVNQTITSSLTEEEVFEKICRALVEKIGLQFVWIGFPQWETGFVKPKYYFGYEAGYLERIKVLVTDDAPEGRGPVGTALRENRVTIIPETRIDPNFSPWREEALKRQYLSVAAIPICKEDKPYCVLALYAKEPNFFTDETLDLLKELKGDIEFALKRVEEIKNNIIISQALIKSPLLIMILDEKGNILYANETMSNLCEVPTEEILRKNVKDLFIQGIDYDFYQRFLQFVSQGEGVFSDVLYCPVHERFLETKIYGINVSEKERRFLFIARDISREKALIEKLEQVTLNDPLTGLLNLEGLEKKFAQVLDKVFEGCLFVVDIFYFAYLNQIYGFKVGDEILRKVGKFLKAIFPKNGLIARIGADSFACFLPKEEYRDIQDLLEKLSQLKEINVKYDNKIFNISTNIGVSFYPKDGKNLKDLIEKASLSLTEAKRIGAGEIKFFNPVMELKAQELVSLDHLLEKALKERLFVFYYQPYFRTKDLSLAGVEALVRIKVDNMVYTPYQFIDYLEKSRFLPKFEEWMLEEISQKTKKFKVPISVNISGRSFSREGFIDKFLLQFKGKKVNIEITERVFIEDVEYATNTINKIKEKDIKIAIDDFGTGYCAFPYLRELPVDLIKIDRSFIKDIAHNQKDRDLVEVISFLAKRLCLETLAEGVETQEQFDIIKQVGCDYVQGFLFEIPLPEEELLAKYPFIAV